MPHYLGANLQRLLSRIHLEGGSLFIHEMDKQIFPFEDIRKAQSFRLITTYDPPGHGAGMHIDLTDAGRATLRVEA